MVLSLAVFSDNFLPKNDLYFIFSVIAFTFPALGEAKMQDCAGGTGSMSTPGESGEKLF